VGGPVVAVLCAAALLAGSLRSPVGMALAGARVPGPWVLPKFANAQTVSPLEYAHSQMTRPLEQFANVQKAIPRGSVNMVLEPGSTVPEDLKLQEGPFPPMEINLAKRFADKNVVLVGLPGAFTPT